MSILQTAFLLGIAFGLLSLGIFISMRIFRIPDITTDGSFTLGGAVTAVLTLDGVHPVAILPCVFLTGAFAGVLTGWIHTRLKVDALLSGILVTTGLYSVNLAVMGRSNLPLIQAPSLFTAISLTDDPVSNQTAVLTAISVVAVIILTWLLSTDFGLAMRATGDNEQMIRAFGVNTDRMKVTGLALANGLTALSGYLITYVQGYADINMGIGIVLLGIGSVMIGAVLSRLFRVQRIWILLVSVLAGSVLFRIILGTALTMGIDPLYLKLVVACFVLAAVSLPRLRAAS
ncbi:MAG: hypothetical protein RL213_1601 [Bacteroidota bacterium]